ncbi:MAG: hypothetical protein KF729_30250 [Sandaracinaceae bacterium]|nr:hypothetical protein [Sandaracinaceae bacterium]
MIGLRYTLLADGTSDRALEQVVSWALRRAGERVEQASWADFSFAVTPPRTLRDRVREAIRLYPCDLLFVHRDAEALPRADRRDEIRDAVASACDYYVPIVPVRMTEAWLLHDEAAIRQASGNPSGSAELNLPAASAIERIADPKSVLSETLLSATELTGRRRDRKRRELPKMRRRVADLIDDFGPLVGVPAFDSFLADLAEALEGLGAAAQAGGLR